MIQGVLSNLDSSYYNVVSDIIDNIDHNIIKTFGMNIGFNSWTEGVKRLDSISSDIIMVFHG